jgi:hypothetical protein
MLPFLYTTPYKGWVAQALNGGDISMFVGLPVAGILYYLLGQSLDVTGETRVADEESREVEAAARQHARPESPQ